MNIYLPTRTSSVNEAVGLYAEKQRQMDVLFTTQCPCCTRRFDQCEVDPGTRFERALLTRAGLL